MVKIPEEDKSVLVKIYGKTPFIKVVDTLLDHPSYEYTKKELAEVNNISRPTLYKIWDKLERLDIVKKGRKLGNTKLYKLKKESKLVEKLYKFEKDVMEDKETKKMLKV